MENNSVQFRKQKSLVYKLGFIPIFALLFLAFAVQASPLQQTEDVQSADITVDLSDQRTTNHVEALVPDIAFAPVSTYTLLFLVCHTCY